MLARRALLWRSAASDRRKRLNTSWSINYSAIPALLRGFVTALVDQVLHIEFTIAWRVATFTASLAIEFVGVTRREIVRPSIFEVSVNGALGMIGCILNAFDDTGFERLIAVGEFLHAHIRRVGDGREALTVSGLSGTIGTDLPGVTAQIIRLCLFVATCSVHYSLLD
jgi:hypothetical protein